MSKKRFEKFVVDVLDWPKVMTKAPTLPRGNRIQPSDRSNSAKDKKKNFRLDKGAFKNGLHHVIVQANKDAEDKSVRELAAKNSHAVLAEAAIDPKNDPDGKKTKEQLIADFERRRDEREKSPNRGKSPSRDKASSGGDKSSESGKGSKSDSDAKKSKEERDADSKKGRGRGGGKS